MKKNISKASQLRNLLRSKQLSFILEAHNALSAKIVEEAGFPAIWASGLCLSASMGRRDNNELSWTQVLDILEFMSDATSIPILLDGDTGYGNFNNMQLLVRKLEQIGVAGVCIEDKLFPKTNSFISSPSQELADIDEFCGKIRAGRKTQENEKDDDKICIVARTEALIVGAGLEEALKRAEAYREAGADAILVHSKKNDAREVLDFAVRWKHHQKCPLIIVPTTYYKIPVSVYKNAGIRIVIWANHLLRASVSAMRQAAEEIKKDGSPVNIEDQIASVQEIFRLQNVSGLLEAEKAYMPQPSNSNAIILAASRGEELGELTRDKPKAMLDIAGKPILQRLVENLREQGVKDITVVTGHKPRTVNIENIKSKHNPLYNSSRDLVSFGIVRDTVGSSTIISYGDVLVRNYVIRELLQSEAEITIVVDSAVEERLRQKQAGDYVVCSVPDSQGILLEPVRFKSMYKGEGKCHGQWIGIMMVKGRGKELVSRSYDRLKAKKAQKPDKFNKLSLTDLLDQMAKDNIAINVLYIRGHWLDVNHLPDIEKAVAFTKGIEQ